MPLAATASGKLHVVRAVAQPRSGAVQATARLLPHSLNAALPLLVLSSQVTSLQILSIDGTTVLPPEVLV